MNDFLEGDLYKENSELSLKNKPFASLYNLGFGMLIIYILYNLMKK